MGAGAAIAGELAAGAEQVLLFRVGPRVCGLSVQHVAETLRPLACEPFADMPAFVLGVCRLRSEPTVVLELERALFGAADGARPQRWIALKRRERPVALAVTDVLGVQRLDLSGSTGLPPLLASSAAPFVERLAALDQQLFVLLNTARLLPDFAWPASAVPASRGPSDGNGDQPR